MGRLWNTGLVLTLLPLLAGHTRAEHAQEPVYGGKPLSYWIDELSSRTYSRDPRLNAFVALRQIGAPAVLSLADLLNHQSAEVRRHGAYILATIGPEAKAAVPALTAMLQDKLPELRAKAAEALGQIGPEAKASIPILAGLLRDTEPHPFPPHGVWRVGDYAAAALASIGPESVPVFVDGLKDADSAARWRAAETLGRLHLNAHEVVPALISALTDTDAPVRAVVVQALGNFGSDAKSAVDALIPMLDDQGTYQIGIHGGPRPVCLDTGEALKEIGLTVDEVPAFVKFLEHPASKVRSQAAELLGYLGPLAHEAIPALTAALPDRESRVAAAHALARIDLANRQAMGVLISALDDPDDVVRWEALRALADLGPSSPLKNSGRVRETHLFSRFVACSTRPTGFFNRLLEPVLPSLPSTS